MGERKGDEQFRMLLKMCPFFTSIFLLNTASWMKWTVSMHVVNSAQTAPQRTLPNNLKPILEISSNIFIFHKSLLHFSDTYYGQGQRKWSLWRRDNCKRNTKHEKHEKLYIVPALASSPWHHSQNPPICIHNCRS